MEADPPLDSRALLHQPGSFRQCIAGALRDAHASMDKSAGLKLPWEEGSLKLVFGRPAFPGEPPVVRPPMELSAASEGHADVEQIPHDVRQSAPVFAKFAVRKLDSRPVVSQQDKEDLAAQRFEVLLSHYYGGSQLGRSIAVKCKEERVAAVHAALGGKAISTLDKRLAQAMHYVQWCTSVGHVAFPITGLLLEQYTEGLCREGCSFSKLLCVLEMCYFLHHVLGVDMDRDALASPLVKGRLRRANLVKPAQNQAAPLGVRDVRALECLSPIRKTTAWTDLLSELFCLPFTREPDWET